LKFLVYANIIIYGLGSFFLFTEYHKKYNDKTSKIFLKNYNASIIHKKCCLSYKKNSENINISYKQKNFIYLLEKKKLLKKIRKDDGYTIWQTVLPKKILVKPLITKNDIFLFLESNTLFVIDIKNGKKKCKKILKKSVSSLPIHKNNLMVINTLNNQIFMIDLFEYKILWFCNNFSILKKFFFYKSIFINISKKHIIGYFINNRLVCFNSCSGLLVWLKTLNKNYDYRFFLKDRNLYISNGCNKVISINIKDGKKKYMLYTKYFFNKMYITGKKVIITQNNGIIKCFQKENGIFLWENQFLYNRNVIILKKKKRSIFFIR